MFIRWCFLLALFCTAVTPGYLSASGGQAAPDSLVGSRPVEWQVSDWLNSEPVSLAALRGKVVLVRWWTTGCMLCASSTGSLNILHDRYASQGLFVAGFYHHKVADLLNVAAIHDYAKRFDYQFPIAIDRDWRTLQAWWLNTGQRDYTSVSLLLDRDGVIRYVHRGGRLAPGGTEFEALDLLIQQLLSEKTA